MRHGEVQALKWEDFDAPNRTIAITSNLHRETGKGWVEGPTKTGKSRVVHLQPSVAALLKEHKTRQNEARLHAGPAWQDNGLIFTNEVGQPLEPDRVQRALDRACNAAGVERRTVKELRHTFATIALRRRVPVKMVSEALGHAKVTMTLDTYSHVVTGMHEDAFGYLDDLLA
jgi:integrase